MNGRVYDPRIGRFISADPFVPFALDSQSLNRYSYVRQSPLSATDPSGFIEYPTSCDVVVGCPGDGSGSEKRPRSDLFPRGTGGTVWSIDRDPCSMIGSWLDCGMRGKPLGPVQASPVVSVPDMGFARRSMHAKRLSLRPLPCGAQAFTCDTWDPITNGRIDRLHPMLRDTARRFINRVEYMTGIRLRVSDGIRTFYEQALLYGQGRWLPGPMVTNSMPGQSAHNFGLAIDVVEILNGRANYDLDFRKSMVATIAKQEGLFWGGEFRTFRDRPHFEISNGTFDWREAMRRYNERLFDDQGFIVWP